MTNEQKERVRTLQAEGMGYSKIAGMLGLSPNTIKAYLYRKKEKKTCAVCAVCGKPMADRRPNQKFCSPVCKNRWWAAQRRINPPYASVCAECGSEMRLRYPGEHTYCSKSCALKARHRKAAAHG